MSLYKFFNHFSLIIKLVPYVDKEYYSLGETFTYNTSFKDLGVESYFLGSTVTSNTSFTDLAVSSDYLCDTGTSNTSFGVLCWCFFFCIQGVILQRLIHYLQR